MKTNHIIIISLLFGLLSNSSCYHNQTQNKLSGNESKYSAKLRSIIKTDYFQPALINLHKIEFEDKIIELDWFEKYDSLNIINKDFIRGINKSKLLYTPHNSLDTRNLYITIKLKKSFVIRILNPSLQAKLLDKQMEAIMEGGIYFYYLIFDSLQNKLRLFSGFSCRGSQINFIHSNKLYMIIDKHGSLGADTPPDYFQGVLMVDIDNLDNSKSITLENREKIALIEAKGENIEVYCVAVEPEYNFLAVLLKPIFMHSTNYSLYPTRKIRKYIFDKNLNILETTEFEI